MLNVRCVWNDQVVSLLALACAACDPSTSPPSPHGGTGSIVTGRVSALTGTDPVLSRVYVRIGERAGVSGPDGRYTIRDVPAGLQPLLALGWPNALPNLSTELQVPVQSTVDYPIVFPLYEHQVVIPPVPVNVFALPAPTVPGAGLGEPQDTLMTINWSPSPGATSYWLYWRLRPGVTPVNSERERATGIFRVTPNTTYYFVVTAVNAAGESAPSVEFQGRTGDQIYFRLERPSSQLLSQHPTLQDIYKVGDSLDLVLEATSPRKPARRLVSVRAKLADRSMQLAYSPLQDRWLGEISLTGLPRGIYPVVFQATGSNGSTAEASAAVLRDAPPEVEFAARVDGTVASPGVHITATCRDDHSWGCTGIVVGMVDRDPAPFVLIAPNPTRLDTTISLGGLGLEGQMVQLGITVSDSARQTTTVIQTVTIP